MKQYFVRILILTIVCICGCVFAGEPQAEAPSFSSFITLALDHSLDLRVSQSEVKAQEAGHQLTSHGQYLPQVSLFGAYSRLSYDRLRDDGSGIGKMISNNGQNTSYGLTVSYDLQKLLGTESEIAKQSVYFARLQEKITKRDIIRNLKKSSFIVFETQKEIEELNKMIQLFAKTDAVLEKQKSLGISNELERQQFLVQKSILNADLEQKKSDLEVALLQLSVLTHMELKFVTSQFLSFKQKPKLIFASKSSFEPDLLEQVQDREMLESLGRDYDAAKLEYEKYTSLPLPSVYFKNSRDFPTTASSDGPQANSEIGLSIPLDAIWGRSDQKSQLASKAEKNHLIAEKALADYRSQIRLNLQNILRAKRQTEALSRVRLETEKLLDKSFLYFSQKRIDALGTLDIFQKYLQTVRNSLLNDLQIEIADTELEYLVGGQSL